MLRNELFIGFDGGGVDGDGDVAEEGDGAFGDHGGHEKAGWVGGAGALVFALGKGGEVLLVFGGECGNGAAAGVG